MSDPTAAPAEHTAGKHTAGAFDVRNVIAGLIGLYGIVLVVLGIVGSSAEDQAKTGGWNANLWSGIVMIVVALVFAVWTRLRPVVVDAPAATTTGDEQSSAREP
ncbi:hypothetical protein SAMN05661080_00783 [Modestobacter sp. DSM 44400]|uniref:hypothetical protein n=1 Tax=Modestobacter sp. DSM 44400 TaxID=1550230 RepID=UPI00089756FA|nr:hypothetical protein [Modestobacter sp. DSM 44400]SDX67285.1 hypothetical protein SAMN05661080_00783 [Modestobacter sp. DSM 44400]